jgi:hypothetical protein
MTARGQFFELILQTLLEEGPFSGNDSEDLQGDGGCSLQLAPPARCSNW